MRIDVLFRSGRNDDAYADSFQLDAASVNDFYDHLADDVSVERYSFDELLFDKDVRTLVLVYYDDRIDPKSVRLEYETRIRPEVILPFIRSERRRVKSLKTTCVDRIKKRRSALSRDDLKALRHLLDDRSMRRLFDV